MIWSRRDYPSGDHIWRISNDGEQIAEAGFARTGQRPNRAGLRALHHFLNVFGGHQIWFPSEGMLRDFVESVFRTPLTVGEQHRAVLEGLTWAEKCASACRAHDPSAPLPAGFPGSNDELVGFLLGQSPHAMQDVATVVRAAAEAAWRALRFDSAED
jgi:hypothetical protein